MSRRRLLWSILAILALPLVMYGAFWLIQVGFALYQSMAFQIAEALFALFGLLVFVLLAFFQIWDWWERFTRSFYTPPSHIRPFWKQRK